jgi:hypothetical protein
VSPHGDIIALSRGTRSATMIEMLTGLSLLATYLSSLVELPGRRRDVAGEEPTSDGSASGG